MSVAFYHFSTDEKRSDFVVCGITVPSWLNLAFKSDRHSTISRNVFTSSGIHSTCRVDILYQLLLSICTQITFYVSCPPFRMQLWNPEYIFGPMSGVTVALQGRWSEVNTAPHNVRCQTGIWKKNSSSGSQSLWRGWKNMKGDPAVRNHTTCVDLWNLGKTERNKELGMIHCVLCCMIRRCLST